MTENWAVTTPAESLSRLQAIVLISSENKAGVLNQGKRGKGRAGVDPEPQTHQGWIQLRLFLSGKVGT